MFSLQNILESNNIFYIEKDINIHLIPLEDKINPTVGMPMSIQGKQYLMAIADNTLNITT